MLEHCIEENSISKTIALIKNNMDDLIREHYVNEEDYWYSCPKSGKCCSGLDEDECNCGADIHNIAVDFIKTQLDYVLHKYEGFIDSRKEKIHKSICMNLECILYPEDLKTVEQGLAKEIESYKRYLNDAFFHKCVDMMAHSIFNILNEE